MASIPYGTTISYAAFDAATGALNAARAAGTACATSPIPIIYPCQRAVRKNGALKHYGGGCQLAPSHKDNVGHKWFIIAHEKSQLDDRRLILN